MPSKSALSSSVPTREKVHAALPLVETGTALKSQLASMFQGKSRDFLPATADLSVHATLPVHPFQRVLLLTKEPSKARLGLCKMWRASKEKLDTDTQLRSCPSGAELSMATL